MAASADFHSVITADKKMINSVTSQNPALAHYSIHNLPTEIFFQIAELDSEAATTLALSSKDLMERSPLCMIFEHLGCDIISMNKYIRESLHSGRTYEQIVDLSKKLGNSATRWDQVGSLERLGVLTRSEAAACAPELISFFCEFDVLLYMFKSPNNFVGDCLKHILSRKHIGDDAWHLDEGHLRKNFPSLLEFVKHFFYPQCCSGRARFAFDRFEKICHDQMRLAEEIFFHKKSSSGSDYATQGNNLIKVYLYFEQFLPRHSSKRSIDGPLYREIFGGNRNLASPTVDFK